MQEQWSALRFCEELPEMLVESLDLCLVPSLVEEPDITHDLKVLGICSILGKWLLAEARHCLLGSG